MPLSENFYIQKFPFQIRSQRSAVVLPCTRALHHIKHKQRGRNHTDTEIHGTDFLSPLSVHERQINAIAKRPAGVSRVSHSQRSKLIIYFHQTSYKHHATDGHPNAMLLNSGKQSHNVSAPTSEAAEN
jgi:hypothetical protein